MKFLQKPPLSLAKNVVQTPDYNQANDLPPLITMSTIGLFISTLIGQIIEQIFAGSRVILTYIQNKAIFKLSLMESLNWRHWFFILLSTLSRLL